MGVLQREVKKDVSSSGPVELTVTLSPISVTHREGWFKLGDKVIYAKRGKEFWTLYVVNKMAVESVYTFTNQCQNVVVNNVDICPYLNQLITNWDIFVEQQEVLKRAHAAMVLNYATVPRPPRDWEIIIKTLADIVLSKYVVMNFYILQGGREVGLGLYCYENGYYKECEDRLKHEIELFAKQNALLEERLLGGVVGEVIGKIKRTTYREYKPARRCLLFKNKVFCWDLFTQSKDLELSLLDPNPDLIVTHRIPWDINPSLYKQARAGLLKYVPPKSINDIINLFRGLAPKSFKAFLDWVKTSGEGEEEAYPKVALLLEIIGYTLYPHEYPLHKAILLVGDGSNGKSTYLRLIEKILGSENVASVNLTDLDPRVNRFAASALWNKLANISSEPMKTKAYDATLFKMLTGEDLVRFERKHREPFFSHNYAKMIFSANELPPVTEDTYAFWRRWIVIEFSNRFQPNPRFFEETFTPDEIEGIIICALHAFRLVLEWGGFTELGAKDPKEEWLSRSNPIYRVVKKMIEDGIIELDPKGAVVKADLYTLYKKYIEKLSEEEGEELAILEQKDFTRHLTRYFPIRIGKTRIAGKTRHTYIGVKIKNYAKALELAGTLETPPSLVS